MQIGDVRFLYAYDRWATRKVLDAAGGPAAAEWPQAIRSGHATSARSS